MPSIGGISVITIKGELTPRADEMGEITRPGRDGHAYKRVGERAPVMDLMTIRDVDSNADVAAHVNACCALRGTLVTVSDDIGMVTGNVAVLGVEHVESRRVRSAVGGVTAGNFLVTVHWRLQMTT